jgi:peptide/nickel transport system permease protein
MKKWLILLVAYALTALLFGGATPEVAMPRANLAPGEGAWLGTDHLGRDVLAWTLAGTRVATVVGLVAAGIALTLGAAAGLLGGWFGGRTDSALLGAASTVAALPGLLLVLLLAYLIGGGYLGVFVAVGLVSWVGVYRTVRAEVMRLRTLPFVDAARAGGMPTKRILLEHLLPNLLPLLAVQFSLIFVGAVKAEVILSFLGVGMQNTPSWGLMIAAGRWWRLTAAAVAMAGLVLPVQRIGDRLARAS